MLPKESHRQSHRLHELEEQLDYPTYMARMPAPMAVAEFAEREEFGEVAAYAESVKALALEQDERSQSEPDRHV